MVNLCRQWEEHSKKLELDCKNELKNVKKENDKLRQQSQLFGFDVFSKQESKIKKLQNNITKSNESQNNVKQMKNQ